MKREEILCIMYHQISYSKSLRKGMGWSIMRLPIWRRLLPGHQCRLSTAWKIKDTIFMVPRAWGIGDVRQKKRMAMELHTRTRTVVSTKCRETEELCEEVGLHHGLTIHIFPLSTFLLWYICSSIHIFVVVYMIRDRDKCKLLFADALLITTNTQEEFQARVLL